MLFGIGIAIYFAWPREPPLWPVPAAASVLFALAACGLRGLWPVAVLLAGFATVQVRAHMVAAPVVTQPGEYSIDGRVGALSVSASGRPRMMIEAPRIHGLAPGRTPARLRVTLMADDPAAGALLPGMRVRVFAGLWPPPPPSEPGGHDFRRSAWFERIGAVGLARGHVLHLPEPRAGPLLRVRIGIERLRERIARHLHAALPGETGAFAAAILVGQRRGIPEPAEEALRAANLSHLLAISGLHMGLMTGMAYAVLRYGLALVPGFALLLPLRKVAAAGALIAAGGYLLISGGAVSTQRAFVMAAVILGAVLLERPALTLRAVALAAGLLLVIRPESLVNIGFQMSFAATTGLVAVYGFLSTRRGGRTRRRGIATWIWGTALTALIAGLATAPFSAEAFHRLSRYGLLANLPGVPLMGIVIMPMGVAAGLLAPFGLEAWPLAVMGRGIDLLLALARGVAALPGAVIPVAEPASWVMAPIVLGGLWWAIWQGPIRHAGLCAILAGLVAWPLTSDRPGFVVSPTGRQAGVAGPEGRSLLSAGREAYVAEQWLEADGDLAGLEQAAARPGFAADPGGGHRARLGGWQIRILLAPPEGAAGTFCTGKTLLVMPGSRPEGPCLHLDGRSLWRSGGAAYDLKGDVLQRRSDGGGRLWSPTPGSRFGPGARSAQ